MSKLLTHLVSFSLFALMLLLGAVSIAQAGGSFCSEYPGGIVDGSDPDTFPLPSAFGIDQNCTFINFPLGNPLATTGLTPTLNFYTPDKTDIYLIVFDNVFFNGNMACSNIPHKLWAVNSDGFKTACQNIMLPAETIDKRAPANTASIGVPFTYTLTLPAMNFPAGEPSPHDLGNITIRDDLTATGAVLTLVGLNAYYKDSGTPVAIDNLGDNKSIHFILPNLAAGEQLVIEITVVLDDTPANQPGMSFTNTAKWWFSRWIDLNENGIKEDGEFFNPLPGESGISAPMTIVAPNLVVSKRSPSTALNVGDVATFAIDIQNSGGGDAWNATIADNIPLGMCATDPTAALSATILQANGDTLRILDPNADYSISLPTPLPGGCQFSLTMTDTVPIAPEQHLVITYQAQLDLDFTTDRAILPNVAGATGWFSADSTIVGRRQFIRELTDGTPATIDHQDRYIVTAALSGYYFEKTVQNLSSLANPATTAAPGDTLRYKLRVFNVDQQINGITITDQLNLSYFDPARFGNVQIFPPPGYTAVYTFNQTTGLLQITGAPALDVNVHGEFIIEFDITLNTDLTNGTEVINVATLIAADGFTADSDDPHVNGVASPPDPENGVVRIPDPTVVVIITPGPLAKANPAKNTATIGEQFEYLITVPATATSVPLYDVQILDTLPANLRFVSARVVTGGAWTLINLGTGNSLIIEDAVTGIDIPAKSLTNSGQARIAILVELLNSAPNQSSVTFNNRASYTYNRANGVDSTQLAGGGSTTPNMTVVEPLLTVTKAVSFVAPAGKPAMDPATVGDVIEYKVTIRNSGTSIAFDTNIVDTLPANLALVTGSATATINGVAVSGFVVDPSTPYGTTLVWGRENGDGDLDIPAGQSLVLTYQATVVEAASVSSFTNSVYVDWTSLNEDDPIDPVSNPAPGRERSGAGCPSTTLPNDYCTGPALVTVHTVDNTALAKSIHAASYAEAPASTTDPIVRVGDTVTYDLTLHLQEYTTRNVVVEDVLPVGMTLESFIIDAGSNFSYTLATQPTAGAGGLLRWEFGDMINAPSDDGTPLDTLVIRYVARVVIDAPIVGVAYETSILSDNSARLSYAGGDPALYPERLTATVRVDIRQPSMGAISKVALGSALSGSGTSADPYQVNIATDVMSFQLSSCNTGLAPAYGVVLTDLLAQELDQSDLTANPPVVKIGGNILVDGNHYTYIAPGRGDEMRIALLDSAPVHPGECVTVDYSIGFHTDLTVSKSWSNQSRLLEYRSLPLTEQGRIYAASATAQVWMTNLVSVDQLLKSLLSSAEATIGEEVLYQITVPAVPMNAALENVVVTDILHGALEFLSASAVDANGTPIVLADNSTAPGQVSLTMTYIPAGQQAIITLRTRVVNNDQAKAGTIIANEASYTYAEMPADAVTKSISGPLTIVEPLVTVTKTASTTSPQPGDVLTYTLSFTAAGAGAGDYFSNAFDLTIEDSLGMGLAYEPGSATVDGAPLADPLTNGGDGINSPQTLTWDPANGVDIDISEGSTVTVAYQVHVLDVVSPGQTLINSVVGRWTGLKGDQSAIERTGSGNPVLNDYFTQPATWTLTTPLVISFVKSVVNATTGEDPGANAQPGDILRYTLVLTNRSIVPVTNAWVVDELSAQFVPGSLQVSIDSTTNSVTGGTNGTGMVDIRDLTLAATGDPNGNDTLTIEFEATLAPVIQNGTTVLNQAQLTATNLAASSSNETSTLISSAPLFEVQKVSSVRSDDPAVLLAGETLRYTISIRNSGNENAVNVRLRDDIPANTSYVAGSTTLNGVALADPSPGISPLAAGMPVHAPENPIAGYLRADIPPDANNRATVTFDVMIDPTVMAGLVIENQGFVGGEGAGSGPLTEQPSDDPRTPVADDPTRNIVGSLPLLYAHKTVAKKGMDDPSISTIVSPGDLLVYTIIISNVGGVPATEVELIDEVPAGTTYVADSLRLNGTTIGFDGVVSPLIAGLPVQSSDLPGSGIVSAGASALITFEVRVEDDVPAGAIISNQGRVISSEMPPEPTDADGNPSNGHQPTIIVVGEMQLLSITKEVLVVGGGMSLVGGQLEYIIRVVNIGSLPATQVVITDDLGPPLGDQVSYVAGSGTMNGSTAGVSFSGSMLTADFASFHGDLPPDAVTIVRFRVQIDPALPIGTTITNTGVVRWNNPAKDDSASVSIDLGGAPGSGSLNGNVWHDANLDQSLDDSERLLEGWSVELYQNNLRVATATTDAMGAYRLSGLVANAVLAAPYELKAAPYELRFVAPEAGPNTAHLGHADSPFTDGSQRVSDIAVVSGGNLPNLNLPISPNGTVYDSVLRMPITGARLALLSTATNAPVANGCFDDPVQQNQVTAQGGYYKFDLNFSDPSCPPGAAYRIDVVSPGAGYVTPPSRIIPPTDERTVEPFSVPGCLVSLHDTVPETANYCEVVPSAYLPPLSVAPRAIGTTYYLHLTLSDGLIPGQSQLFNNHIPVDPVLDGAVAITKISALRNVSKGQMVPYTITVTNVFGVPLWDIGIVDRFPAGFKYVAGSARLDGQAREPRINGRELLWDDLELQVNAKHTLQLLLVVGAGVSEGEYVNRAQVINTANGGQVSGEATATVRVVPDPTFDCTDVIGKVFDDRNLNGQQDVGESGLAGVRAVTARGLIAVTDEHGRFHITCAVVPDDIRGSNFIVKLDDRTLPSGYRLTTENPLVQRATRGKMLRYNFGATIHRVVGIDIADGVFEQGGTSLRLQWTPKIGQLLEELQKSPAVLRLSYLADIEGEGLVRQRLEALKKEVAKQWALANGGYLLTIETEVFWRRGGPP